jgi:uncharacterized protein GlcG (DUF336 family)
MTLRTGTLRRSRKGRVRPAALGVERLEPRNQPSLSATLGGGVLSIVGDGGPENIRVVLDASRGDLVVYSFARETARFASSSVTAISIDGGSGKARIVIDSDVTQPASIRGGNAGDVLRAGGGPTTLLGGTARDKIIAGAGIDSIDGMGGGDRILGVKPGDAVAPHPGDRVSVLVLPVPADPPPPPVLSTGDVNQLIGRATAASASNDAIIAVVDRGGHLLGVSMEAGVDPAIRSSPTMTAFAVDGAIAEARSAAFFANGQAPLTSRTVQFISQSTITQREVESNPDVSPAAFPSPYGPGFVAPIGIHGHFPPNVPFTPQVDLFNIEGTNRDSAAVDASGNATLAIPRFNVDSAFIPANIPSDEQLLAPDSYGVLVGTDMAAQGRGIGTLPGAIPIYKDGTLVGGIGVFFPGKTGFADEENSALSSNYDPTRRDRSMEAEWMAFAAVGGDPAAGVVVGTIGGVPPVPGVAIPDVPPNRIDLVGITLDIFGPGGTQGPYNLYQFGQTLGTQQPDLAHLPLLFVDQNHDLLKASSPVPDGWLVLPHDGVGVTAAQVVQIVNQGITQASVTRAAIRLPLSSPTRMVFAVADETGNIVGLYRMPDATVFSIDVAVAKARNVAYYANPNELQPIDQVPGVPAGAALSNRTFRYLALPHFPEGIDAAPPGPFSILNDGGVDPATGLNVGPPLPASAFQSVQGYDAFHPGTNFRDPIFPQYQNGIVFFPGSEPIYAGGGLIGGLGVSGDGVDQDDVVTAAGAARFEPSPFIQADQFFVNGVRLPYIKFDRNPQGG